MPKPRTRGIRRGVFVNGGNLNIGDGSTVTTAAEKVEDDPHSSGSVGNLILGVRNDTPGSLVSDDMDYAPLQFDEDGNLRTTAEITGDVNIAGDTEDLDTGAGEDPHEVFAIGLPADGGHVAGGTEANPLIVGQADHDDLNVNANMQYEDQDVTAANPLPVSAASLPLPEGGPTEATLQSINVKMGQMLNLMSALFNEQRKTNIYLEHISDLGLLDQDFIEGGKT